MELGEDKDGQTSLNSKIVFFALGSGALSAILGLSLITGNALAFFLAYLAPFPLFLVGLGNGGRAAAVACFSGIVFAGLLGGPLTGSMYAVMNALPAWLAIRLVLTSRTRENGEEWFPLGHVLSVLTVYGSAVFVLSLIFFNTGTQGIAETFTAYLTQTMASLSPSLAGKQGEELVKFLSHFFPAMVLVSWTLMTVVNATLAQAVLVKSGKALRPKPKYGELTLPDFTSWVLVGCATLTIVGGGDMEYIARNLALVMFFPFFALGLTIIHKAVRLTPLPGALLGAFYVLLLLSAWVALPTIGLGLIEQWIGLRHKIKVPPTVQEND